MEREIKFRIWNGMFMEYNITVGRFGVFYVNPEKGDGLNPEDSASLTSNTTKYHEDTPLMQFTGLKDMNGKEIYEGDICKCYDHPTDIESGVFEVICDEGMFSCSNSPLRDWGTSWIEVIGNIHENPELLT